MARPARPERSRSARSSRQLSRFQYVINSDRVFGTHNGQNETEQPYHSASLGDSIRSSTQIRFSVHTALVLRQSVARDDPLGCRCARRSLPSRIRRAVAHRQCGAGAGLKGHLVRDSQLEAAGALPLLADARLPFPASYGQKIKSIRKSGNYLYPSVASPRVVR